MAVAVAGETFRRLEAPSQEILADECMVLSELSVPASEHSTPERDSTAMMSVEEEAETAVEQEDVAEEVDTLVGGSPPLSGMGRASQDRLCQRHQHRRQR